MSLRLVVLLCAWLAGCASMSTSPAADGGIRIGAVQGTAARSTLEGRDVIVTGVVTRLLDEARRESVVS